MSTPPPEAVAAATEALERVRDEWMARPEVVSVEVGRRAADTSAVCVRVTIRPESSGPRFPSEVAGIPVETVVGSGPSLEGSIESEIE